MDTTSDIPTLMLRGSAMDLSRCRIMGILNVTPDSFSDGGRYAGKDAAVSRAFRMAGEGADIIDVGGESTRPGAETVSVEQEIARVVPVIAGIRSRSDIPVSIDTRKAEVAAAAIAAGADMVNDVSALRHDDVMADVIADSGYPVVLMHMQGTPETMQDNPRYGNVVEEVLEFFAERIAFCTSRGITRIVLDPGIGFGKTLQHNLTLLRALPRISALGYPLLVGASRKGFIGTITGLPVERRLSGSLAAHLFACRNGAHLLRVHDVEETRAALTVLNALEYGEVPAHAL